MGYLWIAWGVASVVAFWEGFAYLSNPFIGIVFVVAVVLLIGAVIDFLAFLRNGR